MPIGYFKAKHGAEQAITESGVPFTTLRAAQFNDLPLKMVRATARMPVIARPVTSSRARRAARPARRRARRGRLP